MPWFCASAIERAPVLKCILKLWGCNQLVFEPSKAAKVDGGAESDNHMSIVDGKIVPHGSLFKKVIKAIKAKRQCDDDAGVSRQKGGIWTHVRTQSNMGKQ